MQSHQTIPSTLLFFALFLSACTSPLPEPEEEISGQRTAPAVSIELSATAVQTPAARPPFSPDPPASETAELSAATPTLAAHTPPVTQYILTAELDYDRKHLTVDQQIRYSNRTTESIPDLLLMVEPMYFPGVFLLNSLTWEDGMQVEGYAWDGSQLRLPLAQPLAPGESLGLALSFELYLPSPVPSPATRPVVFGYTPRQTNLVDWYPFIPPYIPGQGWLAHRAGYFGEHLAYEAAHFQVNIQLSDAREDLTIAASAPAEIDGNWHRYHFESARNFAWSVSHDYQVLSETVGEVTIHSYVFPAHLTAGEQALRTTAQSLALFTELFGPYPHRMLSVVEADFLDGMEYDGLYFLSNGFYNLYSGKMDEYLTAIAAHETAHQWWYGLVGNDQALEPWLDEALCTYSERLFYENVYPDGLNWWWAYRVNYYEPRGWVNGSIYNPAGYRPYRDAVYLNGAVFLEALRDLIGDDAFFAFLKDYIAQYSQRIATGNDFFTLLGQHTQADFKPLLDQYFNNPP